MTTRDWYEARDAAGGVVFEFTAGAGTVLGVGILPRRGTALDGVAYGAATAVRAALAAGDFGAACDALRAHGLSVERVPDLADVQVRISATGHPFTPGHKGGVGAHGEIGGKLSAASKALKEVSDSAAQAKQHAFLAGKAADHASAAKHAADALHATKKAEAGLASVAKHGTKQQAAHAADLVKGAKAAHDEAHGHAKIKVESHAKRLWQQPVVVSEKAEHHIDAAKAAKTSKEKFEHLEKAKAEHKKLVDLHDEAKKFASEHPDGKFNIEGEVKGSHEIVDDAAFFSRVTANKIAAQEKAAQAVKDNEEWLEKKTKEKEKGRVEVQPGKLLKPLPGSDKFDDEREMGRQARTIIADPDAPMHMKLLAQGVDRSVQVQKEKHWKRLEAADGADPIPKSYADAANAPRTDAGRRPSSFDSAESHISHYANRSTNTNLPPAIEAAAEWYTYHGDQHQNRLLRGHDDRDGDAGKRAASEMIPLTDAYTRANRLDHDLLLHRGLSLPPEAAEKFATPGSRFTDHGYGSTSAKEGVARRFANNAKDENPDHEAIVVSIEAPKGTHAAYITPHSHIPNEAEFLLARGATYETVSSHRDAGGRLNIRVRVTTPDSAPPFNPVATSANTRTVAANASRRLL